jgi:hypothetical protein
MATGFAFPSEVQNVTPSGPSEQSAHPAAGMNGVEAIDVKKRVAMRSELVGRRFSPTQLFYITHVDNVPSMFVHGILSHQQVVARQIPFTPIYDPSIVGQRKDRKTPDGKSLWDFANLFFQVRNPMLYRVICERPAQDVAVLGVEPSVMAAPGAFVTTGNAAHHASTILPSTQVGEAIRQFKDSINLEYWKEEDGSKRKIMAECLVPDLVPADKIRTVYAPDFASTKNLRQTIASTAPPGLNVIPDPHMFFQPWHTIQLTPRLALVKGDMFFSRMQTLTVSVNVVGVMGKGLASRAKYQFPDVYVKYQDVCRNRSLKMGKPYLYKRESSFDYQLADDPQTLKAANLETWFLLFATKEHWRDIASKTGIQQGLEWLQANYRDLGIKSIAVPALGCGLGRLEWREMGPILCKYLASLEIPAQLYLPAEREIPEMELRKDFLLRGTLG